MTAAALTDPRGVYDHVLDVAAQLGELVEQLEARYHVKDGIDREMTHAVVRVAQAASEVTARDRRAQYRQALRSVTSTGALLDLAMRRGATQADLLASTRREVAALVTRLAHLAAR